MGGGELHMIDVGANIGDTAIFANAKEHYFLLIEGEEKYNTLIQNNLFLNNAFPHKQNIIVENTFIGDTKGNFINTVQNGTGTLSLTSEILKNNVKIQTLDHIVQKHHFIPNFIKIDTDGFDFKVIRSAETTLKQYQPLVLFEWDKFLLKNQNENPFSIFGFLKKLNYKDLIIFDNFGTLLCKEKIDNYDNLQLLLDYTEKSNKNIFYYDILAIPLKYEKIKFC